MLINPRESRERDRERQRERESIWEYLRVAGTFTESYETFTCSRRCRFAWWTWKWRSWLSIVRKGRLSRDTSLRNSLIRRDWARIGRFCWIVTGIRWLCWTETGIWRLSWIGISIVRKGILSWDTSNRNSLIRRYRARIGRFSGTVTGIRRLCWIETGIRRSSWVQTRIGRSSWIYTRIWRLSWIGIWSIDTGGVTNIHSID